MFNEHESVILCYPAWYRLVSWVGFLLLLPSVLLLALIAYAAVIGHQWFVGGLSVAWAAGLGYVLIRSAPALFAMNVRAELTRDGLDIRKGYPPRFIPWQEFGEVREFHSAFVRRYLDLQGNEILTVFTTARGLPVLDALLQYRVSERDP